MQHGAVKLVWSNGELEFTIPSTLSFLTTDENKANLLIELVRGVKNKVDVHPIVEAVKKDARVKKTSALVVAGIILGSLLSFFISLVFYSINNRQTDFLFGFFGFLGLVGFWSLIPVSLLRSRSDFKSRDKLIRINYHHAVAVAYLNKADEDAKDLSEEQIAFLLEHAQRHLEKIIDIDPTSPFIEKLRTRIF